MAENDISNYFAVLVYAPTPRQGGDTRRADIERTVDHALRRENVGWVSAGRYGRVINLPSLPEHNKEPEEEVARNIAVALRLHAEQVDQGETERQAETDASRAYVNITEFAQDSVYRNAWTARVEAIARG